MAEARTATPAKGDATDEAGAKKGKKKLFLIIGVAALALAGGGYYFLFMKGAPAEAAPVEKPKPVAGAVVSIDPISINLAEGHYLKLGLALQQTAEVTENVDGSQALDTAIELYSGKSMAELSDPTSREAVKKELSEKIEKKYEDKVMDVYFTQYVMQ
ncbi:flagellar FliL protein [Quadrisphaera granulorum]|uniref:Flagellar protein FliL n=1 Tax=Quadrisphaera granulorum TaxID=317664 RepID=A0A316A4U9_9ACTN|nr:flagellar basal body-associated FliL family protein [Quadrisphaera granulorum]PWJ52583.1 flagellar FliL protein [Quadrisphaera granulorum]SZE97633.1 flagellar FliL protein [Quadrisphaera granulorum]